MGGIIQMDPNYLDPNHSSYRNPEPYYSDLFGRDFIIDLDLPLFSDPEKRVEGSKATEMRTQTLQTFQTNFPGFYNVEIIFYDIRGAYAIMKIPVEVKPWWSY